MTEPKNLSARAKNPRWAALDAGKTRYRGKKCKYGHPGLRYTSCAGCVQCIKLRDQREYAKRNRIRNKFIAIPNWGKEFDKSTVQPLFAHYKLNDEGLIKMALTHLFQSTRAHLR